MVSIKLNSAFLHKISGQFMIILTQKEFKINRKNHEEGDKI